MSRVRSSLGSRHLARDRVLGLSANSLLDENGRRLPVNIRTNIGPDRFDLLLIEHTAPRWHLVFSIQDRVDEPIMILRPQASKVERHSPTGILQPLAMARRAVIKIHHRARLGARVSVVRQTDWSDESTRDGRHSQAGIFVNTHWLR
jgi:hypothetical protein